MPVDLIVSPELVTFFQVSSVCMKVKPCQHECKIVLSDGREKKVFLSKSNIGILINDIAQEKIVSEFEKNHFTNPLKLTKTSTHILSKLFDKTIN